MGNYFTITLHAALAGIHPSYSLLGFSAALAPKCICWFDINSLERMSAMFVFDVLLLYIVSW